MNIENLLRTISESATIRNVFGDPATLGGKTIVPVARVAYGFGGGSGTGPRGEGEGGGAGGGVRAFPVGVLEVTEDATRFIAFVDRRRLAAAFAGGVLAGVLLARGFSRD